MGVALQHGAVHKRAGVALVGVADHILLVGLILPCGVPFEPGGEARAAAAPQPGDAHLFNDLLGRHGGDRLLCGLVAAGGYVLFDVLGIDNAAVAQHDALLLGKEGLVLPGDGQILHDPAVHQVLFHDGGGLIGLDLHITGLKGAVVPVHVHDGFQVAGAHAAGQIHGHIRQALFRDEPLQLIGGLAGAGRYAAAALSNDYFHFDAASFARMSCRMALTFALVRFP